MKIGQLGIERTDRHTWRSE